MQKQLTGCSHHLVGCERPGKKVNPITDVVTGGFAYAAQDKNGDFGQADVQFGYELGTAYAGHVQPGYDQAKIVRKLRLLDQAKSIGRITHSLHVVELPL